MAASRWQCPALWDQGCSAAPSRGWRLWQGEDAMANMALERGAVVGALLGPGRVVGGGVPGCCRVGFALTLCPWSASGRATGEAPGASAASVLLLETTTLFVCPGWFILRLAARRSSGVPTAPPRPGQVQRLFLSFGDKSKVHFWEGTGQGGAKESNRSPRWDLSRVLESPAQPSSHPPQGSAWDWWALASSSSSLGCSCTSTRCSWPSGT